MLSRRTFLNRAGLIAALGTLGQLARLVDEDGWIAEAAGSELDLTRDTFSGLAAFVVPGQDPYSLAQGESSDRPGGVEAGVPDALIELLDRFVPFPVVGTFPTALTIAALLNQTALTVNPAAANGVFLSPFARLSFDEKIETFQRLEESTEGSQLRAAVGILLSAVGFLAYSEVAVLDPDTGGLRARPVGWDLSGFGGPVEGRRDFRGYYQGRRRVVTARRYRRRRPRRRRRRGRR